jgi:sugar phosphate isomerase/epimerase
MTPPIALQLYTLRSDLEKDFEGTLKQVADLGYAGVELAGMGGRTAAQLRELLDGLGLKVASAHVGLQQFDADTGQVLDDLTTLGSSFVAIPFLPPELRGSAEAFLSLGQKLNRVGAQCKERGIQLCYHNHNFEFEKFDGVYALDLLYQNTDPQLLQAEIDAYWVQYAGEDPVAYIKKYADRTPLVHLKDMADDGTRFFAEVGTGLVDIDAVIAAATSAKWLIVEQDQSRSSPLESVAISIENLRKKGYA